MDKTQGTRNVFRFISCDKNIVNYGVFFMSHYNTYLSDNGCLIPIP